MKSATSGLQTSGMLTSQMERVLGGDLVIVDYLSSALSFSTPPRLGFCVAYAASMSLVAGL